MAQQCKPAGLCVLRIVRANLFAIFIADKSALALLRCLSRTSPLLQKLGFFVYCKSEFIRDIHRGQVRSYTYCYYAAGAVVTAKPHPNVGNRPLA